VKICLQISRAPLTLYLEANLHHGDWSINEMSERVKLFVTGLNSEGPRKDAMIEKDYIEVGRRNSI